MKIGQTAENLVSKQVGTAANGPKVTPGSASAVAAQAPQAAGVAVTMSNMARGLEKAARTESSGDIDAKKVAAVKSAIEDGSFSINPEAIADKLMADAKEMFERTTR